MNHVIQRIARLFSKFIAGGASLSMIGLFSIIFINSIRRYTFGKSLEFGEELPIYIAIYGVIFGVAWAYMSDRHIRFTMLIGFISRAWTQKLYVLVDLIMIVNGAFLTCSGWMFVNKRGGLDAPGIITLARELKSMTGWDNIIWIGHMYPYQAAMMIGGILLTTAALLKFCLRILETPEPQSAGV